MSSDASYGTEQQKVPTDNQNAAHVLLVDDLRKISSDTQQQQQNSDVKQQETSSVTPASNNSDPAAAASGSAAIAMNHEPTTPAEAPKPKDPTIETALIKKQDDYLAVDHDSYIIMKNRPLWLNIGLMVLHVGCGMVEGYGMNRVGLSDPTSITQQFTFRVWIVLNIFISAVAATMFTGGVCDLIVPSLYERSRASHKERAGWLRIIIGGLGVGFGLALAGSGPTIMPSQLAAGTGNTWITLLGMLGGALAYSIFDLFFGEDISCPLKKEDKISIDDKWDVRYWKFAIPGGAIVFGGITAVNVAWLTPANDESRLALGSKWADDWAWPGIAAGAFIGIFQISYRILAQRAQGGATSYMSIVSTLTCGKLAPKTLLNEINNWWQLLFVWLGTSLGSLAARETGAPVAEGLTAWRCAVGGFVVLFSARISNSCTCGGISLAGEGSLEGLLLVSCIFVGGIIMGWILVAAGAQPGL